jgi:hypothetical protein
MFESNTIDAVAVQQKTEPPVAPPYAPTGIDQILLPAIIGIATALGLPKLLELWSKSKIVEASSDRRRNDAIYDALIKVAEKAIDGLIDINKIAITGQLTTSQELLQNTAVKDNQVEKLIDLFSEKISDEIPETLSTQEENNAKSNSASRSLR